MLLLERFCTFLYIPYYKIYIYFLNNVKFIVFSLSQNICWIRLVPQSETVHSLSIWFVKKVWQHSQVSQLARLTVLKCYIKTTKFERQYLVFHSLFPALNDEGLQIKNGKCLYRNGQHFCCGGGAIAALEMET